jgi:hypothetical protein
MTKGHSIDKGGVKRGRKGPEPRRTFYAALKHLNKDVSNIQLYVCVGSRFETNVRQLNFQ